MDRVSFLVGVPVGAMLLVVLIALLGLAPQANECLPVDRVILDNHPFTGVWWVQRQEGAHVLEIVIQTDRTTK